MTVPENIDVGEDIVIWFPFSYSKFGEFCRDGICGIFLRPCVLEMLVVGRSGVRGIWENGDNSAC